MPTAYANYLRATKATGYEQGTYPVAENIMLGFQQGVAPHGFQPNLLLQLDNVAGVLNEQINLGVRLDWEFDVVVRGLRTTGAV